MTVVSDLSTALYAVLLLFHVLLFVYWLGADLAVLYSAHYAADPALSAETRATISDIMAFIDMFPRLSVPLIGAVGAQLAVLGGYAAIPLWALGVVWVLALTWAGNGLIIFRRRKSPALVLPARRFDLVLRLLVLLLVLGAAFAGLAGVGPIASPFLVVKLFALAAAIILSFLLRRTFAPFRPALNRILDGSGNDHDSLLMQRSLARSRPVVFCLWGSAVVGAAAGLWGTR
jgi:hypothetical protein